MIDNGAKVGRFDKRDDVNSAWSIITPLVSQQNTRKVLRLQAELARCPNLVRTGAFRALLDDFERLTQDYRTKNEELQSLAHRYKHNSQHPEFLRVQHEVAVLRADLDKAILETKKQKIFRRKVFGLIKSAEERRFEQISQHCNSASGVQGIFSPSLLELLESVLPTSIESISRLGSEIEITFTIDHDTRQSLEQEITSFPTLSSTPEQEITLFPTLSSTPEYVPPTLSVTSGLTNIPRGMYSIMHRDITIYTVHILKYAIKVDSVFHIPGFSSLLELALSVIEPVQACGLWQICQLPINTYMQKHWPEERSLGFPCLHLCWFVLAVQNYTEYGSNQQRMKDILPFIPSFTWLVFTFQPLQDILEQEIEDRPQGRLNDKRSAAIDANDAEITLVCLSLATQIGSDVFTLHLSLFHEDSAILALYWRVSETLQPQQPQLSRDEQFEMLVRRVAALEQELAILRSTLPR
ncbi:hypothetical protein BJ165DRAFT_602642 [Panaeolus papilionaceus]|nr:hypothetical protein BJ165DRAFT_602642 [Panaeolus papilionaceus]